MSRESQTEPEKSEPRSTLLLVSSDEGLRLMFPSVLEALEVPNYHVVTVEKPATALEQIVTEQIDVVIADHKLVDIDGTTFLEKVMDIDPDTFRVLLTPQTEREIPKHIVHRTWDRQRVVDLSFRELQKKREEMESFSEVESLYETRDGRRLLEALLDFTPPKLHVRTVVERQGQTFPDVPRLEEKLELLAAWDFVKRRETLPILFTCPNCGSDDVRVEPVCPKCGSRKVEKGTAMQHEQCSTIAFGREFEQEEGIVCPGCGETLAKEEVDYRELGTFIYCGECDEYFENPELRLECNTCDTRFTVKEAGWDRREQLVPNKQRIRKFMHKTAILSALEQLLTEQGMVVRRNVVLKAKESNIGFKLVAYRHEPENIQQTKPELVVGVGYHQSGQLQEDIRLFAEKLEKVPFTNLSAYFIGSPFLSSNSKALCEQQEFACLEIADSEEVDTIFTQYF